MFAPSRRAPGRSGDEATSRRPSRLATRAGDAAAHRGRPLDRRTSGTSPFDGRTAALADSAREKMGASRALLDSLRGEHTYGVNTGFGRFVSESIPEEHAEELQLRLLRSHACGVGEPYPRRCRARGDAATRECAREGLLGRARQDGRAVARAAQRAASCRSSRPGGRSGRAATSLRSHTWRSRSSARVRRGSTACADRRRRARRAGLEPIALAAKEGLSLINGTQFMAAMASLALVRARRLSRDCGHRLRDVARGAAGLAHELHPAIHARARTGARAIRRERAARCSRARRSSSPTAGATRCRTRTRCDARRRCTAPAATCSTTSSRPSTSRSTPPRTTRSSWSTKSEIVSNGNFHGQPLAFALDALAIAVAELANISERRVERMVNPSLSDGLPAFLDAEGGHQLRLHDPPVRGRGRSCPRTRCSRTRRASTRSPRAPGRRITSRWATPPV